MFGSGERLLVFTGSRAHVYVNYRLISKHCQDVNVQLMLLIQKGRVGLEEMCDGCVSLEVV